MNLSAARAERDRLTQAIKAGRSPAKERRKQAREADLREAMQRTQSYLREGGQRPNRAAVVQMRAAQA